MLFGAAIALGAVVSSRPPGELDVSAQSLRGEAIDRMARALVARERFDTVDLQALDQFRGERR